jgi:hypothetical protein
MLSPSLVVMWASYAPSLSVSTRLNVALRSLARTASLTSVGVSPVSAVSPDPPRGLLPLGLAVGVDSGDAVMSRRAAEQGEVATLLCLSSP